MSFRNPIHRPSRAPTRVSRARRPLDRAYTLLSLLFLFALAAIVYVGVIQASPSTTPHGIGWVLDSGEAGTALERQANDSPMQVPTGPDQIGFERQLYAEINKARLDRGLPPLQSNQVLTRVARARSAEMAATLQFDPARASAFPVERAESAGYAPAQVVLEMSGAGYSSPEQVVNALLANPNTLANLSNADVNEIGVGYAYAYADRDFRHYWAIDVGRKSGLSFTVVVNNGVESTTSAQVTLYIGGEGWAQQMQISNSPDFENAPWEPYAETKTWTLSDGTGPKKIYVKLSGADGQEVVIVGTVAVDAAAKGVKPSSPYADSLTAPRPPILRFPAPELSLNGEVPPAALPVFSAAANNALSPSYYQTSEFMFGEVAVGLVTPQCNGRFDKCSETWTPAMLDQVAHQVNVGLDWWTKRMNGKVSFVVDQQRQIPTGYEPINHSQADESLWIGDVMTNLGFKGSTYFEQVYAYNNWLRQKYGTDWAFTLLIANSEKNKNGTFSNGFFAYSYVPGPFTVATYDNDGYTINNMAAVIAHETGHVFGALDQYAGAKIACTATSGYLVLQNQNSQQNCSSNIESIMRGGLTPFTKNLIDPYALGMVGNRSTNGNDLPDPINTTPVVSLNPLPPVASNALVRMTGTAQDQPFRSPNGSAITINHITAVKYRVDGGPWQDASPADGSPAFGKVSQTFAFTPSLTSGAHRIEVQAFNRQRLASSIVGSTVTVPGENSPALSVQARGTPTPPARLPTPGVPLPTLVPPTKAPGLSNGMLAIPIPAGNALIAPALTGHTASTLLEQINAQGGSVTQVDAWTGQRWQHYAPGGAGVDFEIRPGTGYVVKAKAASTWTIPANASKLGQPIRIDQGWTLLGIPPCRDGSLACHTASSLASAINAQGGEVTEIARWVNGGWSAYLAGFPFNDFAIQAGQAYFIRSSKTSTWTP